jgi:hypothetical protein
VVWQSAGRGRRYRVAVYTDADGSRWLAFEKRKAGGWQTMKPTAAHRPELEATIAAETGVSPKAQAVAWRTDNGQERLIWQPVARGTSAGIEAPLSLLYQRRNGRSMPWPKTSRMLDGRALFKLIGRMVGAPRPTAPQVSTPEPPPADELGEPPAGKFVVWQSKRPPSDSVYRMAGVQRFRVVPRGKGWRDWRLVFEEWRPGDKRWGKSLPLDDAVGYLEKAAYELGIKVPKARMSDRRWLEAALLDYADANLPDVQAKRTAEPQGAKWQAAPKRAAITAADLPTQKEPGAKVFWTKADSIPPIRLSARRAPDGEPFIAAQVLEGDAWGNPGGRFPGLVDRSVLEAATDLLRFKKRGGELVAFEDPKGLGRLVFRVRKGGARALQRQVQTYMGAPWSDQLMDYRLPARALIAQVPKPRKSKAKPKPATEPPAPKPSAPPPRTAPPPSSVARLRGVDDEVGTPGDRVLFVLPTLGYRYVGRMLPTGTELVVAQYRDDARGWVDHTVGLPGHDQALKEWLRAKVRPNKAGVAWTSPDKVSRLKLAKGYTPQTDIWYQEQKSGRRWLPMGQASTGAIAAAVLDRAPKRKRTPLEPITASFRDRMSSTIDAFKQGKLL